MKIDVSGLSRTELQKLRTEIDRRLEAIDRKSKEDARKAAEEAVKKFGFSLDDLVGRPRGGKAAKSGAAKYRNPANPKQTWTGRGRQPGWIKEGLAAGMKIEDFAI